MGRAECLSEWDRFGTGKVSVLVGQVWYRHIVRARCLYQPVPLGQGKVKRDLSLSQGQVIYPRWCPCPRDRSYTHAGGLSLSQGRLYTHDGGMSLSWDRLYTHDGACPSPTCPNLSYKVGLQGRGIHLQFHSKTLTRFYQELFLVFCCYATTQLALQLCQGQLQVVCSNKEARKRLTESNGTPAMYLGHMNVVWKRCICMLIVD